MADMTLAPKFGAVYLAPKIGAMTRSLRTNEYQVLRQELIALRNKKSFTQRDLAKALGVARSWVSNVETGDRRIDVIEVCWICDALGVSPAPEIARIVRKMRK